MACSDSVKDFYSLRHLLSLEILIVNKMVGGGVNNKPMNQ